MFGPLFPGLFGGCGSNLLLPLAFLLFEDRPFDRGFIHHPCHCRRHRICHRRRRFY